MTIVERVRESKATELDRLGSSKAVLALTGADLDTLTVLRAAAAGEARAAETFDDWAGNEADEAARGHWKRVAEQEREHAERVASAAEGELTVESGTDALHEYLRELMETDERVGGFVGRCLVADATLLQLVNFFVNESEEAHAELFRELRAETADSLEAAESLVDEESVAVSAAEKAIAVSYDAYADSLSEIGIDAKPVC